MKKNNKLSINTQQGFTLIELVVVIVILGILAATAAPKFIDLTGDAKASTVQAVRGSIESGTAMVHAKALVGSQTGATGSVDVNGSAAGGTVSLINGWPSSTTAAWAEILDVDVTSANSPFQVLADDSSTPKTIYWYPRNSSITTVADVTGATNGQCYVVYSESTSSSVKPAITVVTSGC